MLSVTALIVTSPWAGRGSPLFPPSLWNGREFLSPISGFPEGRCHKTFVHHFRYEDTSYSGLIPISLFNFHTLGPA